MTDAILQLRELRPDEPAPDPALLERILATPPAPPPRSRPRAVRRIALAGAALALVAVTLTALVQGSPSVVARAAAALNDPDTILHFRTEVRNRESGAVPDAEVDGTFDVWQTAGARQRRILLGGGSEVVEDRDAKTASAYIGRRNELVRYAAVDADQRGPLGIDAPVPEGGLNVLDDLAQHFERARRGDGDVRLVGPTIVRGIEVYELEFAFTVHSIVFQRDGRGAARTRPVETTRTVYVDRETSLPVRVVERTGRWTNTIADYVVAERLPRTADNERLLKMSPHPGAKQVDRRQ